MGGTLPSLAASALKVPPGLYWPSQKNTPNLIKKDCIENQTQTIGLQDCRTQRVTTVILEVEICHPCQGMEPVGVIETVAGPC